MSQRDYTSMSMMVYRGFRALVLGQWGQHTGGTAPGQEQWPPGEGGEAGGAARAGTGEEAEP